MVKVEGDVGLICGSGAGGVLRLEAEPNSGRPLGVPGVPTKPAVSANVVAGAVGAAGLSADRVGVVGFNREAGCCGARW